MKKKSINKANDICELPQTLNAEQVLSYTALPPLSRYRKKEEQDTEILKLEKRADELEKKMYSRMKRATLPALIKWLSSAYCYITNEGITDKERVNSKCFLSDVGYIFLPGYANAGKTEIQKRRLLGSVLNGGDTYEYQRDALANIGKAYFASTGISNADEVKDFLSVQSVWCEIIEIFAEYQFVRQELLKAELNVTAA